MEKNYAQSVLKESMEFLGKDNTIPRPPHQRGWKDFAMYDHVPREHVRLGHVCFDVSLGV